MLRLATIAAVAALALTTGAHAQQSDDAKPEKEKKICHREAATGSIMPKRVCRTKSEWEAISAQSRADLERTNQNDRDRRLGQDTRIN